MIRKGSILNDQIVINKETINNPNSVAFKKRINQIMWYLTELSTIFRKLQAEVLNKFIKNQKLLNALINAYLEKLEKARSAEFLLATQITQKHILMNEIKKRIDDINNNLKIVRGEISLWKASLLALQSEIQDLKDAREVAIIKASRILKSYAADNALIENFKPVKIALKEESGVKSVDFNQADIKNILQLYAENFSQNKFSYSDQGSEMQKTVLAYVNENDNKEQYEPDSLNKAVGEIAGYINDYLVMQEERNNYQFRDNLMEIANLGVSIDERIRQVNKISIILERLTEQESKLMNAKESISQLQESQEIPDSIMQEMQISKLHLENIMDRNKLSHDLQNLIPKEDSLEASHRFRP